jgi:4-hydroxy-2-oxoglutarate aldolase
VLVVTPSYFRAQMTEAALIAHYTAVADASPLPVLLYNVPQFTGVVIPPTAVERLAAHPNVAGLKDSAGDIGWLVDVLGRVPASFQVLCGAAGVVQTALAAGAVGGILAIADVLPEPCVALFREHASGRPAAALALQRRLLPAIRLIAGRLGVAGVKAAMDERGLAGGAPRPPLLPVSESDRAAVRACLAALVEPGVLPALAL